MYEKITDAISKFKEATEKERNMLQEVFHREGWKYAEDLVCTKRQIHELIEKKLRQLREQEHDRDLRMQKWLGITGS